MKINMTQLAHDTGMTPDQIIKIQQRNQDMIAARALADKMLSVLVPVLTELGRPAFPISNRR